MAEELLLSTDLHISVTDTVQNAAALDVLERSGNRTLLLLGDLTNNGRTEEHAQLLSWMSASDGRIYVLPGNHDLTGRTSPEQFRTLYHAYGWEDAIAADTASLSYAVMEDGLCLLMLDTNGWNPEKKQVLSGQVEEAMISWVRDTLQQLPEGTPVIACGHHPLIPYEGNDTTRGAEKLVRALVENGVRMYLCGHRHSNYTLQADGLRQVAVGVPWSYPALLGNVHVTEAAYLYDAVPLYPTGSTEDTELREAAAQMAEKMAEGALRDTSYAGNAEAIAWFLHAFAASTEGRMQEESGKLLAQPGYVCWKKAEVRSAVKPWILSVVENPMENYHHIEALR